MFRGPTNHMVATRRGSSGAQGGVPCLVKKTPEFGVHHFTYGARTEYNKSFAFYDTSTETQSKTCIIQIAGPSQSQMRKRVQITGRTEPIEEMCTDPLILHRASSGNAYRSTICCRSTDTSVCGSVLPVQLTPARTDLWPSDSKAVF